MAKLGEHGHEAVAASPNTGVNTITGEGLAEVMTGAQVVIDVSNSPSFEDKAVLKFFETSTRNLLAAEAEAGVGHHVAVSIVGTERMPENGYFRAKIAQEQLIEKSGIPFSLVHATQFFEFVRGIADDVHGRRHGTDRARALPAHGRRRRGAGGRQGRRRLAAERQDRDRRARAVPDGRVLPRRAGRLGRPAPGGHRRARALLRQRAERAVAGAGRRRHPRQDPLPRLAPPRTPPGSNHLHERYIPCPTPDRPHGRPR